MYSAIKGFSSISNRNSSSKRMDRLRDIEQRMGEFLADRRDKASDVVLRKVEKSRKVVQRERMAQSL